MRGVQEWNRGLGHGIWQVEVQEDFPLHVQFVWYTVVKQVQRWFPHRNYGVYELLCFSSSSSFNGGVPRHLAGAEMDVLFLILQTPPKSSNSSSPSLRSYTLQHRHSGSF